MRIGVAPIAYQPLLDRAIGTFAGTHPDLAIEIRSGGIEEVFSLLSSEAIDLAIGSTYLVERWTDVQTESLTDLRRHFIARRGQPASKMAAYTEAELMQFPIVAHTAPCVRIDAKSTALTSITVRAQRMCRSVTDNLTSRFPTDIISYAAWRY